MSEEETTSHEIAEHAVTALTKPSRLVASRLLSQYRDTLGALYAGPDTNWAQIDVLAVAISKSAANLASLTGGETLRKSFAAVSGLFPAVRKMMETFDTACACRAVTVSYAGHPFQCRMNESRG